MSLACVLINEPFDRLVMVCVIMLLFLVLHLHVKPFKMVRMNQMEVLSSVSILLMAFFCFIMNSHVKLSLIHI